MSPNQVGDLSLCEFFVAMHGLAAIKSPRPQPMTDEDFEASLSALRSVAGDDVRF